MQLMPNSKMNNGFGFELIKSRHVASAWISCQLTGFSILIAISSNWRGSHTITWYLDRTVDVSFHSSLLTTTFSTFKAWVANSAIGWTNGTNSTEFFFLIFRNWRFEIFNELKEISYFTSNFLLFQQKCKSMSKSERKWFQSPANIIEIECKAFESNDLIHLKWSQSRLRCISVQMKVKIKNNFQVAIDFIVLTLF